MFFSRCWNSKSAYPKSIFFILGNEFCERFSYYGMRAVLILYLTEDVMYPRDQAKQIYHGVTFLNYFMPLFGALLADTYFGKFKTIWTVSIIYTIGQILMSLSSIHSLQFPRLEIAVVALVIIAVGSGGIKPCVSAFGGDQFEPSQYTARDRFYSIFYFFINSGALLSMIISPIFRTNVYCFGKGSCYPLAFGFPAILMIIATVVFLCGWRLYKIQPAQGNAVVDVSKCIVHALRRRRQTKEKRDHWMDYADDRFDSTTINDVKTALSVLVMFLPIPIFWALFDQQGSAWTLQSAQMDGRTSFLGEIKPDQMDALNAALVMVLVPIFSYGVYPLLGKFRLLTRPLQRMATGMLLAALAFLIAAFVYMRVESGSPALPYSDKTELVMHNAIPCDIKIELFNKDQSPLPITKYERRHGNPSWMETGFGVSAVQGYSTWRQDYYNFHETSMNNSGIIKDINIESEEALFASVIINDKSCLLQNEVMHNITIQASGGKAYGVLLDLDDGNKIRVQQAEEVRSRNMQTHKPKVRFVRLTSKQDVTDTVLLFKAESGVECADIAKPFNESGYASVRSNTKFEYCFANREGFVDSNDDGRKCPSSCHSEEIGSHYFDKGGIFTAILIEEGNKTTWNVITTAEPDKISIFNQIPQYFVLTCGEVMLSITALSFAYAEAPDSLKSLFQAAWLMTVAVGNIIVLIVDIIKESSGVHRESTSFIVYAVIMVLDVVLFIWLARRYKYRSNFNDENTKM